MAKLVRAITEDGSILATVVNSTDMCARAEEIHKSSAVVTAAMGRLMTASSMMGAALKGDDDTITLRVKGGGPIGAVIAVSDAFGNARVSVTNPIVELPLNDSGKLDVGGAVGTDGFLAVIRDHGEGEPQTGYSPLVTGEIGDDLTYFFANSEQVATVCALGVLVAPDLKVQAAGGYLLQLLPGADDETIDKLEEAMKSTRAISTMINEGMTEEEILKEALKGFEFKVIEDREIAYTCNCSREKVEKVLISLGKKDLNDLSKKDEKTVVQCHFCEKAYSFSAEEMEKLSQ